MKKNLFTLLLLTSIFGTKSIIAKGAFSQQERERERCALYDRNGNLLSTPFYQREQEEEQEAQQAQRTMIIPGEGPILFVANNNIRTINFEGNNIRIVYNDGREEEQELQQNLNRVNHGILARLRGFFDYFTPG